MSETLAPVVHKRFTLIHGDSVEAMAAQRDGSVGLVVTSPPFSDLFVYSKDDADLGNAREGGFNLAFRMWCEQLFRVVAPGRLAALHTTQLLAYKVLHGFMGLRDFVGSVVAAMKDAKFEYSGEIAIDKNPQSAAQRMKLHNLMFVTLKKDSSKSVPVRNDYLLLFRKPGENAVPVASHARGEVTEDEWIRWAHGCWTDIDETDVLKTRGTGAADDEKHVCPLQLQVIDRAVRLWSNPGELVMDPFSGIGSTGYAALKRGRRYLGVDLKAEHHKTASRTLKALAKTLDSQLTLFGPSITLAANTNTEGAAKGA